MSYSIDWHITVLRRTKIKMIHFCACVRFCKVTSMESLQNWMKVGSYIVKETNVLLPVTRGCDQFPPPSGVESKGNEKRYCNTCWEIGARASVFTQSQKCCLCKSIITLWCVLNYPQVTVARRASQVTATGAASPWGAGRPSVRLCPVREPRGRRESWSLWAT